MNLRRLNEEIEDLLNSIGTTQKDVNKEKLKLQQEIKELQKKRDILASKNKEIGYKNKGNKKYFGSSDHQLVKKNQKEIEKIESHIKEKERDIQKLKGFKEPNQLSLFN